MLFDSQLANDSSHRSQSRSQTRPSPSSSLVQSKPAGNLHTQMLLQIFSRGKVRQRQLHTLCKCRRVCSSCEAADGIYHEAVNTVDFHADKTAPNTIILLLSRLPSYHIIAMNIIIIVCILQNQYQTLIIIMTCMWHV